MTRTFRTFALASLLLLSAFAGWRITRGMVADASLAAGDVDRALRWQPENPDALLQKAERELVAGRYVEAAKFAKRLLKVTPVDGRGYRVLAEVADAGGRKNKARELFNIAARRAPRDVSARAWLAQDALERDDSLTALRHIDNVLTLSPAAGAGVFPVLVTLAADPEFADALAQLLRRPPPWREGMLATLRNADGAQRVAAERVLLGLQGKGGFDAAETAAWTQSLLDQGRWGEAYARWASPIIAAGRPLPLLYNGDFSGELTEGGFDWLMPTTPGVLLELEPSSGSARIMHARFLGRRMTGSFLQHRLLLAPGAYQLHVRQRMDALRSDNGLQWTLECEGSTTEPLARTPPLAGTQVWKTVELRFEVAPSDCVGQWLRLGNAGAAGAGQLVSGDLWLDTVVIRGLR